MSEESPLFPLKPHGLFSITKSLLRTALPTSLAYLAGAIHVWLSYGIADGARRNTAEQLAGFSLGYGLINLFCLGPFLSIDQGFAILASKLFGAKKYQEMGVLYQRNLFISTIIAIPMILAMIFSGSLLKAFGVNKDVSASAGFFIRSMIPSLIATYVFNSTRNFLISQNIFGAPTIILLALLPLHLFLARCFCYSLQMQIAGVGFAKSATDIIAAILLFLYIRRTDAIEKETWIPWTKECLEKVGSHLKRTLMLGAPNSLEIYARLLSMCVLTALNNPYILEAHVVAINVAGQLFCIPLGITLAMQAQIGNAIGEGYKHQVQKILAGGIILNSIFSFTAVAGILIWRKDIITSCVYESTSREILTTMLPICLLAHIPDSFARIIGGVLRAVGKERKVLGAFFLCYFGICVTGQWILGVHLKYGYISIWLCTAGAAFLMCVFMVYAVWTLDWKEQIRKVKRALDEQIYAETQSGIEFADMVNERKVFIEKPGEDETKDSIQIFMTD